MDELERDVEQVRGEVMEHHNEILQLQVNNTDLCYRNNMLHAQLEMLEAQVGLDGVLGGLATWARESDCGG